MNGVDEQELQNVQLSDAERRGKRMAFLELFSQLEAIKENATTGLDSTRAVFYALNESSKLVNKVFDPQILALDAGLISLCSDILKRNVEALDINLEGFKPEEFSEATLGHLGDGHEDLSDGRRWKSLVEFVNKGFKVSHTPFFMRNNIDFNETVVRPPRKPRKSHAVDKQAQVKKPEKMKTVEKEEDGIEESVEHMMGIIISEWRKNGKKPLSFFSLVVNPDSFSTTVENIFHFSFLVRDLMVNLIMDDNGDPVVEPTLRRKAETENSNTQEGSQFILSINMEQWQEIKQLYNIKKAMIPPLSRGNDDQD